ncbi:MAG TPA: hypothetical protein DEF45_03115 [Rhodopirellula sp.]|nr:MAG: hypothetical protein CBD74_05035 [Saprospirales bacterium TMED214]HBV61992.1 hypothetical protein [Rhodopirellula sp.]
MKGFRRNEWSNSWRTSHRDAVQEDGPFSDADRDEGVDLHCNAGNCWQRPNIARGITQRKETLADTAAFRVMPLRTILVHWMRFRTLRVLPSIPIRV